MKGTWQDEIMRLFPGVMFIDPRKHGCHTEEEYTAWDLTGVAICDIVFGYMEASNPAGQGLCVEFGAARVLQKYIIYVEEARDNSRYFGMTRVVSDEVTEDFYSGIYLLQRALGLNILTKDHCNQEYFKAYPNFFFNLKTK